MGAGYYLGESKYHGWIIEKVKIFDRERAIEEFAYTAGQKGNIHVNKNGTTQPSEPKETKTGVSIAHHLYSLTLFNNSLTITILSIIIIIIQFIILINI